MADIDLSHLFPHPAPDQGRHSSTCWAFVAVAMVEATLRHTGAEIPPLSVQHLIDNNPRGHQFSGTVRLGLQKIIDLGGLPSEADYPYVIGMKFPPVQRANAVEINDAYCVKKVRSKDSEEDEIIALLRNNKVVAACMFGYPSFMGYETGIYMRPSAHDEERRTAFLEEQRKKERPVYGHAILIIGCRTINGINCWLIRNSYGPAWGMGGTGYIARASSCPDGKSLIYNCCYLDSKN